MLEIHYLISGSEVIKTYDSPELFLASQYREVPDLEDYYPVIRAMVAGVEIPLVDKTINGLFNQLNSEHVHVQSVAQAN